MSRLSVFINYIQQHVYRLYMYVVRGVLGDTSMEISVTTIRTTLTALGAL